MISNFIFIFQQPQIQYKHLDLNNMSMKMSNNFKRMKSQAIEDYKKLMNDLDCSHTEPNEDLIFVKYRRVRDRVRAQVLIEVDFNKFLE